MLDTACIEEYRKYLLDVRLSSANTVASYIRDITKFAVFLDSGGKNGFADATEDDVRSFVGTLEENGKSPATISRSIASLKSFFSRLAVEGTVTHSPAAGVTAAVARKDLPLILSGDEIERLLEQPDISDRKGCRDKAMLETLYATGLRVSELLALDETDVNLDTGLVSCRGSKERSIPVYTIAATAIGKYLSEARPMMAAQGESALFVNTVGKRMSRQGFWKLLKSYAETAQIKTDITPQILRNSFAAHLIENGVDLRVLQQMLGHADISSTQVYARIVKKQLKDVYNKSHPRA